MALSNPARTALGAGGVGLTLTVINQLIGAGDGLLDPALERASVLAGILSVLLMLAGLLWTRVQPEAMSRVALPGEEGLELMAALPEALAQELGWGSTMLLTATPAAVVLLQWRGHTLLRRGLLAEGPFLPGPICERAQRTGKAISLVDLRLYPGRGEFDGLLPGLPAVVVQPLGEQGLLLIGGWSARCFSRSDLLWIEGWSRRIRDGWAPALNAASEAEGAVSVSKADGTD